VSERHLILAALDAIAVAVALIVAFNIRGIAVHHSAFAVPLVAVAVTVTVWLVCSVLVNGYDLHLALKLRSTARGVAVTLGLATLCLVAFFFLFPYRITRPTLALWVLFAGLLVMAGRLLYRHLFATGFASRLALVGSSMAMNTEWPLVQRELGSLYQVVVTLDPGRPDFASCLDDAVVSGEVHQIVLSKGAELAQPTFRAALLCLERGARVRSMADLYEEVSGRILLEQLGPAWLMGLPAPSAASRFYGAVKRGTDIVASVVGLVIVGAIAPILAAAMWLDDRGPLFHRQVRVGRFGVPFTLLKFRTMRVTIGENQRWTEVRDSRITRVGRLLRRLHLDELPQVWSILKGEMSLVGPRPEQPEYASWLGDQVEFYSTRMAVRPGLTGWAQVNFGYGSGVDGARVKLTYDLYYVKHESINLDLLIIAKTIPAVFSLRGR
jgi:exopolysaccharide biosynthesis polyprenyl glycosylphosphotransferase